MRNPSERVLARLQVAVGVLFALGLVASGFIPPAVVVLSIPFLLLAWRRPVLRRLAVRNAARRPRETALILLGALLGTAIITGSAIVGDTLGASVRRSAYTQLGPIDETVRPASLAELPGVTAAVRDAHIQDVDGVLPLTLLSAAVAGTGPDRKAEPAASLIETDFAAAQDFGGDAKATGISGATPGPGSVAITRDLARTVGAGVGDSVDVFVYGTQVALKVDRILPRRGVAGLHFGFGSASPNAFVAPGTIAALAAAKPATAEPPIPLVAVSNRGGVIAGASRSAPIAAAITKAVAGAGYKAQATPAKKDLLDAAEAQGKSFTQLFTSIGFFSVIAGILLLVSIFVMLAEERKTELGMLRAIGLRRSGLVGTFSLEGWMYSLASAALGTIAGLGVGRAIVLVTAGIFGGRGEFSLELKYTATLASVHRGFLIGFVMSLLTVVLTSLSTSRLNVIRAIRDLPNPGHTGTRPVVRAAQALVVVLGVLMTMRGVNGKAPAPLLLGPPVIALGVALLLRRRLSTRAVDTVASAVALAWAVMCFDVFRTTFKNPDISLFVVDGVALTVSAVFLVSRQQELIGHAIRRIGGGSRNMSLRLGLAYPLARTFRTAIVLMTFALTMFTLVSMTLFSGVFSSQIGDFTRKLSGGFDAEVSSNPTNPIPVDALRTVPGVEEASALTTTGAEFNIPGVARTPGQREFEFAGLAGFDDAFVRVGPPALQKFDPRFHSAGEAWAAVEHDPSLAVVTESFLQDRGGPPRSSITLGTRIVLRDPATGATHDLTVAGLLYQTGFGGGGGGTPAYVGESTVRTFFGDRAAANFFYVKTKLGADPQEVADRIDGRFVENGASGDSFRQLVDDRLSQQQQFLHLMQGYLALGLLVGVAGLGVVMVRAVRERRREVGILRSLGFETKQVRRAFIAESSFVALEGILLGTALAVISTWRLLLSGAFGEGLTFSVPLPQVALIVGLAFLATLIATAAPAQQASKIRPAVALRIAD